MDAPGLLNLLAILVRMKSLSDMCVRAEEKELVFVKGTSVPGGGVE